MAQGDGTVVRERPLPPSIPPWVGIRRHLPALWSVSEERAVDLPDEVTAEVRRRLRKVAGQVAGIERMLDEGRECRDIVTQVSAATHALEQAGLRVVVAGMRYCIENPEAAAAEGYPLDTFEKLLLKLG